VPLGWVLTETVRVLVEYSSSERWALQQAEAVRQVPAPWVMLLGQNVGGPEMSATFGHLQPLVAHLRGPPGWGQYVAKPRLEAWPAHDQLWRCRRCRRVSKKILVLDRVSWMVLVGLRGSGSSLVGR